MNKQTNGMYQRPMSNTNQLSCLTYREMSAEGLSDHGKLAAVVNQTSSIFAWTIVLKEEGVYNHQTESKC